MSHEDHLTRDSLRVFFEGEEALGIIFFVYQRGSVKTEPPFPLSRWPSGTRAKYFRLFGDGWTVHSWDVALAEWPDEDQWSQLVEETLKSLYSADTQVAWCGFEGHFVDPPGLFTPSGMSGGVYAAYSRETGLWSGSDLGSPLSTVSDARMLELRRLL